MQIPPVNLAKLESLFAQLERHGVNYGLGAKAPSLDCDPSAIHAIDCSGFVRYVLHKATDGKLTIPDGSQNQRAWCEGHGLHQIAKYSDVSAYMTNKRLFICFIKPFAHGCGKVGHVWLVSEYDDGNNGTKAGTMESHGGVGVNSRPWNYRTLVREFYSGFALPTE